MVTLEGRSELRKSGVLHRSTIDRVISVITPSRYGKRRFAGNFTADRNIPRTLEAESAGRDPPRSHIITTGVGTIIRRFDRSLRSLVNLARLVVCSYNVTRIGAECTRCVRVGNRVRVEMAAECMRGTIANDHFLKFLCVDCEHGEHGPCFSPTYEGVEARLVPLAAQFLLHLLPRRAVVYPL